MEGFAKLVAAGTVAFLVGRFLVRQWDRVHISYGGGGGRVMPIGQSTGGDGVA